MSSTGFFILWSFFIPIFIPIFYLKFDCFLSFMIIEISNLRKREIPETIENTRKNAVTIEITAFHLYGDPYGTRTHVTAVKGRCLNHLTNGPGSGNLTRTDDTPGMNRMLYQLSYAAISCRTKQQNEL